MAMVDIAKGFTKTYSAFRDRAVDDSRISKLRRLHEELDLVVLDGHGSFDIEVPPYCAKTGAELAPQERATRDDQWKSVTPNTPKRPARSAAKGTKTRSKEKLPKGEELVS